MNIRSVSLALTALASFILIGASQAADSPLVLRYDGGFDDRASSAVTDSLGNVYVAGDVESSDRKMEFAVVKYSPSGALSWTARYANATHGTDAGHVNAIAVDSAGNIYAVGYVWKQVSLFVANLDWLVVSYTPAGVERWSQRINGTADVWDQAGNVIVDAFGNVYVSGQIQDIATQNSAGWTLIKYASNGAVQWRHTDVRTDGARDGFGGMHFSPNGSVVGVGKSSPHGIVTTKVDANGTVVWRSLFEDTSISDDTVMDVDVDAGGNVYWTGETVASTNPELEHVPLTLKYTDAGALQFILRGDGAGGQSVAVAPSGDVVVSGTSLREGGNTGVTATSKYDTFGNRIWMTQNVSGNLAIDSTGNIYTFENFQAFGQTGMDLRTTKLNSGGTQQWAHSYDGSVSPTTASADSAIAALVDPSGNFIAVGNADDGRVKDILTLRYAANVTPSTPPAALNAPTNLIGSSTSGRIALSWTDNSNNEAAFGVERCAGRSCTGFIAWASVGSNVTTYADTGLARNTTYRYRVRATNGATVSAYSNIVTVTTPKK